MDKQFEHVSTKRLHSCVVLIGLVAVVLATLFLVARQKRKADALNTFRHLEALIQSNKWSEAFEIAGPKYRAYANIINFRGDFEYLTNYSSQYVERCEVVGLWKLMQVRLESINQTGWGVFIEFERKGDIWLIRDVGRWTDDDL